MKKDSSEASCLTCTCGCKRGQIKDSRCLPGSRASTSLTSNISEKDRAKDVEQFDDILRTFTNEMNKFENRFASSETRRRCLQS